MPYTRRHRSSRLFGIGADEATTIDLVGVPIVQFPAPPPPPAIPKYVLWGGAALVAYFLFLRR